MGNQTEQQFSSNSNGDRCPKCDRAITASARKCKHCGAKTLNMMQSLVGKLKPHSMRGSRETTITAEFAYSIAAVDEFSSESYNRAMEILGQSSPRYLTCVYCGQEADAWDHLVSLVKNKEYSGNGHTFSNLVPCCTPCNSRKGGKPWREFLAANAPDSEAATEMKTRIENLVKEFSNSSYTVADIKVVCSDDLTRYYEIRDMVLDLLTLGDQQAATIRNKMQKSRGNSDGA